MTVQVGSVVLHDNLFWENEFHSPSVAMSNRRTVGGKLVIQTNPTISGREITLSTFGTQNSNVAYFTRQQIEDLQVIEAAGAAVALTYNSLSTNVVIKPGGLSVEPLGHKKVHGSTDIYVGKLELLETGG